MLAQADHSFSRRAFAGLSVTLAATFASVAAQQAAAETPREAYRRALAWRESTGGTVLNLQVNLHWLDARRAWLKRDLPGKRHEFRVIDAARGANEPAFDHARLAAALREAKVNDVETERLPVEILAYADDGSHCVLRARDKTWRLDLKSYELAPHGDRAVAIGKDGVLEPLAALPPATRQEGPESSIEFVNRTADTVELFWLDREGGQKSYGKVAAGQAHRQHTFGGHVWLVRNPAGQVIAAYRAANAGAVASIDGRTPPTRDAEPRRSRERRRLEAAQSPDGRWEAFVRDDDLWCKELATGDERRLSQDGSADDPYEPRWHWSPDSSRLVVLRTKAGDRRKIHLVEAWPKDQLQPKLHELDYLKPGDQVPRSRPRLFDVTAGKPIPIAEELFANPWSVESVRWADDSKRFTFVYNQRGHQVLRVLAVDAESGQVTPLVNEECATFFDYAHKQFLHFVPEQDELIWMSERDGWNHLYLIDSRTGAVKNPITRGDWVVRRVERVDDEARQISFYAGGIRAGQDPYYLHLARVNFDGTGLVVLTEGDGNHSVAFSPDRKFLVDTWSRVDQPPVHELRRADDGTLACELARADATALVAKGWRAPQPFVAKGRDGVTDIYGIILRPTNFDATKKYPVIEQIYAGPQSAYVPKSFRLPGLNEEIAELGAIVVQIDGMGTSHRSKKFHDVCWKNLADSGFPDRIAWLRAAAATEPAMDLARVGIFGGSAGGQNALRALLAHGDFYQVAVADCGCHDNRMDKIWWNELWMSWPIGPHYDEQSNVTQAHRLNGRLMLVVGELDRNVDPASTMQVAAALVKADKDFDLLVVPGAGHGAAESPYGRRRRAEFLFRELIDAR